MKGYTGSDKVIKKYKYKNTKGGGSFLKRGINDDLTEVEFQNLKFIERIDSEVSN